MAVNPGPLPLSVIRGIAFNTVILRCVDNAVSVSVDGGADVVYMPSGQFSGYDLFILTGNPSAFLYYNPLATSYLIAPILATGGLTNYFIPSSPLTEPTGTYIGVGTFSGHTAVATDHPVDLTGLTSEAQVRRTSASDPVLDLNPSITDAVNGQVTIPAISTVDTQDFDFVGTFDWELVFKNGSGDRFGPYVKGPFVVSDNITQVEP